MKSVPLFGLHHPAGKWNILFVVSAVKAEKKVNLLEPQTVSEGYLNLHRVHALSLENDMKRSVSCRDILPEAHTAATFGHRKVLSESLKSFNFNI